ncbi:Uncharacterized protein APZ42_013858 [Daphnia magna]|uniref:Uncharacterized protein n=1 Tax=Daphnia magna TaxID=35525 RepID=A0A162QH78_9CRUS|nr:Uncharacterized protein APZ42_013858 [Daphnia magna]
MCSTVFLDELKPIWSRAEIPIKADKKCIDMTIELWESFLKLKQGSMGVVDVVTYNRERKKMARKSGVKSKSDLSIVSSGQQSDSEVVLSIHLVSTNQLFSKRFAMPSTELSGVKRMADFIALYYTHAFLRSRLSTCSPADDMQFLSLMNLYRIQDPSASDICVKSILLHLWYLTEELVVFAIFDTDLQDSLRQQMVLKLLSFKRPKIFKPQKPVFPDIDPMTINYPYQLVDFIGSRSWLLFHLLNLGEEKLDWMQVPVKYWKITVGYRKLELIVRVVEVVNDSAERSVELMSDFKDVCIDENKQQALFQVLEQYRNNVANSKAKN